MIITKTPFRMSFLGGGTDYAPFFNEFGGSVIATTFDKYCYVIVRHLPPFFEAPNHIVYSAVERPNTVDEIEHPLIRNAMKMLDMHDLNIVYDSDLPARSGIGSSSSFAVGMLSAFYALKGKMIGKRRLAEEAIYLEREMCNEAGGWQDQISAAYGNLNRINFQNGTFTVNPIIISKERKRLLNDHLMLFFTGFSRISSDIATTQSRSIKRMQAELQEMLRMVDEGEEILTSQCDICEFGRLLDYTWRLKRGLTSKISTDAIDAMYAKAMDAGALGGKLLGAGGGGFLLLFVKPERQEHVRQVLSDLLYVPFAFEESGVQILYYAPETYIKKRISANY